MSKGKPILILIADDDPDDRMLIGDALEEARLNNPVQFVEDGVELMEFLKTGDLNGIPARVRLSPSRRFNPPTFAPPGK